MLSGGTTSNSGMRQLRPPPSVDVDVGDVVPVEWLAGWLMVYGGEAAMRAPQAPSPGLLMVLERRQDDGRPRPVLLARWCPHGSRYRL